MGGVKSPNKEKTMDSNIRVDNLTEEIDNCCGTTCDKVKLKREIQALKVEIAKSKQANVELVWEGIDKTHERAKVIGGWLVKSCQDVLVSMHEDMPPTEGYEYRETMCFVPDPEHEWGKVAKYKNFEPCKFCGVTIPLFTHRDGEPVCKCATKGCKNGKRWLSYDEDYHEWNLENTLETKGNSNGT